MIEQPGGANQNAATILVIDDDFALRSLIAKRIGRLGFTVLTAADGVQAQKIIQAQAVDFIIVDHQLPGSTGLDIIDEVWHKEMPIPFVMVTGQGDERLAVQAMKHGAEDYLVKDNEFLEKLPTVVHRVWQKVQTQRQLEHAQQEKEILQEQLWQSQKIESIGRLAGGVAHDFNNMLGVIIGNTELALDIAQELPGGHSIQKYLEEVLGAANRSSDLTKQLLAFARKQVIQPKSENLNTVIASMLDMLRRLIGDSVAFIWQPAEQDVMVHIDAVQLDQILVNLCVNARDAIWETGTDGCITISTEQVYVGQGQIGLHLDCKAGEYAKLTIQDTGAGIAPDHIPLLFEPFFTTKEIGKGTGLGLATIYGIVRQNHGFIEVHSTVGAGSTFKVFLPISSQSN
jgi:signal transduction histidine kinase